MPKFFHTCAAEDTKDAAPFGHVLSGTLEADPKREFQEDLGRSDDLRKKKKIRIGLVFENNIVKNGHEHESNEHIFSLPRHPQSSKNSLKYFHFTRQNTRLLYPLLLNKLRDL